MAASASPSLCAQLCQRTTRPLSGVGDGMVVAAAVGSALVSASGVTNAASPAGAALGGSGVGVGSLRLHAPRINKMVASQSRALLLARKELVAALMRFNIERY